MPLIDALIFDLDGTLWNTVKQCTEAWNSALEKHGKLEWKVQESDLAGIMGLTREETRLKLFPQIPQQEGRQLLEHCFNEEIRFIEEAESALYPEVATWMGRLAACYPLFLVSNCDEPYLALFLRVTGLGDLVADAECHGRTGRPKGENLIEVIRRNGLLNPLYIGDTEGDARAAAYAKIPFAHLEHGFGKVEQAVHRFKDFIGFAEWAINLPLTSQS